MFYTTPAFVALVMTSPLWLGALVYVFRNHLRTKRVLLSYTAFFLLINTMTYFSTNQALTWAAFFTGWNLLIYPCSIVATILVLRFTEPEHSTLGFVAAVLITTFSIFITILAIPGIVSSIVNFVSGIFQSVGNMFSNLITQP